MVAVVERVSHPSVSALSFRNKGCSFPDIHTSGMRRVKNSFILKDQTICARAQYTALFASPTFPVAASFWQVWGAPFEWGLVWSHFIMQQWSMTKWYWVHPTLLLMSTSWYLYKLTFQPSPPCAEKVSKSPRSQTAKLLENRFTTYLTSAHSKCFSIQVNIRDGKLLPNLQSQKINYFCACSFKGKHAVKS